MKEQLQRLVFLVMVVLTGTSGFSKYASSSDFNGDNGNGVAIIDGVRQRPTYTPQGFETNQEFYMLNVGSGKFFTQGNNWMTQASVGNEGRLVKFQSYGDNDYTMLCFSWRDSNDQGGYMERAWRNVFFDSETALFVDRASQSNYYFSVENSGETFRISTSLYNPTFSQYAGTGVYVGLPKNASSTRLSPFVNEDEAYVDWVFVTVEDYEALSDALALYEKAQELKKKIDEIESLNGDVSDLTAIYLDEDATMAELDAAIAEANKRYLVTYIDSAPDKNNVDVTMLLVNPDFESGEIGWTVTAASGGNVRPGGSSTNHCYEAWNNSNFDIYQEVQGVPVGVYEIQVQGFYRYGRGDYAWNAFLAQEIDYVKPNGVPVYVYMNNNATNFVNVYGDPKQITDASFYGNTDYAVQVNNGTTYYFPNGMSSAAVAFSDGMYKQSAYGLIANEGDVMRIGVKGNSSQMNDSWVIWDDFKLIYRGFNPDVIKPVLETAMEDVRGYLGLLMGKTEYTALSAAFTAAETAIEDNDGEAMFNALNALYDAKDPARISKDIFLEADIAADTLRLAEAIRGVDTQKVPQQTLDEATALLAGICNNQLYENDETDELKDDVTAMINSLRTSRLLMAVVKAEMITDLGKTEDSYAYLQNVIADIRSLNIGQLDEYYVDYYSNRLQNAIDNLQLRPGYAYLTADMFRLWDKCDAADATDLDNSYCLFNLRTSTDMVYGTSQVDQFRYADLSGFDKLYIPVAAGTPRILMNRTEDQGQFSENKEQSKMIEMPNDSTWAEAYYSQSDDGKLFTYDIAKIVEENGFAHLNAIKGAYWQNVTASELILYNSKLLVAEIDYSDYSNYPYYRADAPEGTSYDVVDGRLMINNTLDSLNAWDLQSFIIDGFNIERGHDYIVRITYKSTTSGKANVQFGTWSLDMTKYDVGIDATESFTTVDVLFPMVTCPTDNQDAHVIWHGGSIVGTVEISKVQVYEVLSEDPLFDAKVELRDAVAKAKMRTSFGKTEASFASLGTAIVNAETVLETAESTNEIENALYSLNSAVNNLKLLPGYTYLQDFYWSSNYNLCTPTSLAWGDGDVNFSDYADLSNYDYLYIPVAEGTPRVLMNRTEYDGQFNEDKELSKMLEMPKDGTWAEAYYTVSDNGKMFAFNIAKIVEDYGFARLHAIKDANWGKVTVTDLILYTDQTVAEDEWNQLAAVYESMENTSEWNKNWDFTDESHSISSLPGVEMIHRHIVSIDLSSNNLSGNFPIGMLSLPYLEKLYLSDNQLTGNVGQLMDTYVEQNPTATFSLKELYINNNQLSGNIGVFSYPLTNLTYLEASYNKLEEVDPVISLNVSPWINYQIIDRTIDIDLPNLNMVELIEQIPNILLYDHFRQSFSTDFSMTLWPPTISDFYTTGLGIRYSIIDGKLQLPYRQGSGYVYRGQSGDTFDVIVDSSYGSGYGKLKARLFFAPGDANFDGLTDVLDLQSDINYIFNYDQYNGDLFNFTAANLWEDEVINVQDVVKLVTLILESDIDEEETADGARVTDPSDKKAAEATVYLLNGQLVVNTDKPVATFDIVVRSSEPVTVLKSLEQAGFTCAVRKDEGRTRIIGYSMKGATLPVGETILARTTGNAEVSRSVMADSQAKRITVALGNSATGIAPAVSRNSADERYRMSVGRNGSIVIDSNGTKTFQKRQNQ